MRTELGIASLAIALLATATRADDTRSACITACEATAQACLSAAHGKYDACKPAIRKACAPKPPAELFDCLTTSMKACARTHSAEVGPCRAAFVTCYAACGPRPPEQAEFWCELDSDPPASDAKVRKEVFCAGTPGESPADQHEQCMKRYKPTDPATSFSLGCDPLG